MLPAPKGNGLKSPMCSGSLLRGGRRSDRRPLSPFNPAMGIPVDQKDSLWPQHCGRLLCQRDFYCIPYAQAVDVRRRRFDRPTAAKSAA
jgi:hypothetical protein